MMYFDKNKLAVALAVLKRVKNLTSADIAEKSGVSKSSIDLLCRGAKDNPAAGMLNKLYDAYPELMVFMEMGFEPEIEVA